MLDYIQTCTRSNDEICTLGAPLWRAALAALTSEVKNRARFKRREDDDAHESEWSRERDERTKWTLEIARNIAEGSVLALYVVTGVTMRFFVVLILDSNILSLFQAERAGSRRCSSLKLVSGDYVFLCGAESCVVRFNQPLSQMPLT